MNIDKDIISNYKAFALIKNPDTSFIKYSIREIETRGIVILENFEEAMDIISDWLERGIEVFNSDKEFSEKYPPFTSEERMAISRIFWWQSIPKEQWPKEILEYFEGNIYWQEFRVKNNL